MTKRRTLKTYLTIAFLLIWTPLCALADVGDCRSRESALAYLKEEPVYRLMATAESAVFGTRIEVWGGVNADEFLVLQVSDDGVSCIVDYGTGWLGLVGATGPPKPAA